MDIIGVNDIDDIIWGKVHKLRFQKALKNEIFTLYCNYYLNEFRNIIPFGTFVMFSDLILHGSCIYCKAPLAKRLHKFYKIGGYCKNCDEYCRVITHKSYENPRIEIPDTKLKQYQNMNF